MRGFLLFILLVYQIIAQNATNETGSNWNETTLEENLLELTTPSPINSNAIPVPEIDISTSVTYVLHEIFRMYNPFCWRHSYMRGIGRLPNTCSDDAPEQDGSLCYPLCRTGFNGVGPICWEKCENITSFGFACIDIRLSNRSCPWYDKCGIVKSSCVSCPENYIKLGCVCGRFYLRNKYGRGVGSALKCSKDDESFGPLCYEQCYGEFYGVGPICWQHCPSTHPYSCVAGCSITKALCHSQVIEMVRSVVGAALSILNNVVGIPFITLKTLEIVSKATKYEWGSVAKDFSIISLQLSEKLVPEFVQRFLHWKLDKVESATKNASLILTATAMQDKNILLPFLRFFNFDSVYKAFNHGNCELSNDNFDYDE